MAIAGGEKMTCKDCLYYEMCIDTCADENWEHKEWGQEETTIDWFAIQWSKIHKAFLEADAV